MQISIFAKEVITEISKTSFVKKFCDVHLSTLNTNDMFFAVFKIKNNNYRFFTHSVRSSLN